MNSQEILRSLQAGKINLEEAERELREARMRREEEKKRPLPEKTPAPLVQQCRTRPDRSTEPIAIVGMSGRYPDAEHLGTFWDNLTQGKNSIREIPDSRWNAASYFDPRTHQPGKIYCKWIGLLDDMECFDPLFFNIPPAQAEVMDPQQRIFLQEGYKAFEDAGYSRRRLSNKKCGVYLGIMSNEYEMLLSRNPDCAAMGNNSYAIAAARIPYFLNLKGPAIPIDTACSSSLVSAHLACQALLNREIDMALVGGVTLYLIPQTYIGMCAAGMLSPDGKCKAFDDGADGFVPGEGVGALVLKRLGDAEADGDPIHGLIIGSGINHDGKTNGISAPSVNSQIELEREVYRRHCIDPESISYAEMHGTGTKLGDPIELEALSTVFKEKTHQRNSCAIGSVKSNIGHVSAAAGVASIQKVLLCMKHKKLVPTLHFKTHNRHFNFQDSPFYVNTELREWDAPAGEPRRACVSSFGVSGTNAHIVLEEYAPRIEDRKTFPAAGGDQMLFVLSARSSEQLRLYAERIKDHIELHPELDPAAIAYTLQTGRDAMEHRLAFCADSRDSLLQALAAFVSGTAAGGVLTGQAGKNKDGLSVLESDEDAAVLLQSWVQKKRFNKLAELWVNGFAVDWNLLHGGPGIRRINLPAYPFKKDRYWIPRAEPKSPHSQHAVTAPVPIRDPGRYMQTVSGSKEVSHEPCSGTTSLAPVWDVVSVEKRAVFPAPGDRVVIIGGTKDFADGVLQACPNTVTADIRHGDSIQAIAEKLEALSPLDHVLWIAPPASDGALAADAVVRQQDQGVMFCFRVIKALLLCGYGNSKLGWTVFTTQAQAVWKTDSVNPVHASVHGLIGSMAKEYPDWKVRLIDLEPGADLPVSDIFALSPDPEGNARAFRGGEWYLQKLVPLRPGIGGKTVYRNRGVYVVIGGAGGVGEQWTEYMVRTYRAQVIWIGRRKIDDAIQSRLNRIALAGPAPHYIQADAADQAALQKAYAEIKQRYARVDGVVHSALALLDKSLANMEEDRFRAGLAAKIDVSARIAEIFRNEDLDFILFFSSVNAFSKAPGSSNYASGCTFISGFARSIDRELPCAVKVMNWGYWGNVGAGSIIPQALKSGWARAGIGSIDPPDAMHALEALLSGPVDEMALVKTEKPTALEGVASEEFIEVYPETVRSSIGNLQPSPSGVPGEARKQIERMLSEMKTRLRELDDILCRLLWGRLQGMGLFAEKEQTIADMQVRGGLHELYHRWLEESLAVLARNKYLRCEGGRCTVADMTPVDIPAVWKEWEHIKTAMAGDRDMQTHMRVVETTMRSLPEILTGKVPATDVMFPDGSLELMESMYKSSLTDYFNASLADAVAGAVRERIGQDPTARIRIIEIGAGTGGTSVHVFEKLRPYHDRVQEYCYTDLSRAFLLHAKNEYGRHNPYLTYKIFDLETPLSAQDIDAGGYDIAIATNVLHATKNIRKTLRNVKATLRNNGLLFLNEISANFLFTHLTAGLLEGWWLAEDPYLRIPGCPGLSSQGWKRVLENEGFRRVFFPVEPAHELGHQIVVAESDGVVRQKLGKRKTVAAPGGNAAHPPVRKIGREEMDKLPKGLFTGVTDYAGIAVLKVFQSMGLLTTAGREEDLETLREKTGHGSRGNGLLNALLHTLKKKDLIRTNGGAVSLSESGASGEMNDRVQRIEARSEALMRAVPELSAHISLLRYCFENYAAVLGGTRDLRQLFESGPALRLAADIFSSGRRGVSRLDEYFTQAISANLSLIASRNSVTVADLGWAENPANRLLLEVISKKGRNTEYFYVESRPEMEELIRKAAPQASSSFRASLPQVRFNSLPNRDALFERFSGRSRADVVIIEGCLSDPEKLDRQLRFAGQILGPDGVILSLQYPLVTELFELTFGLLEDRLLFQSDPCSPGGDPGRESIFKKYGFEAEPVFGEWLVLARRREARTQGAAAGPARERIISFLTESFSTLLGVPRHELDPDASLEEYGLDSILMSHAYMLLQKEFGRILSPRDMAEHRTISQLAESLEQRSVKPGSVRTIEEPNGKDDRIISFLAESFSSLLGIARDDLNVDGSLEEYGLDSILMSHAYMLVQKEYGKVLSPKDMAAQNTIRQLARLIEERKKDMNPQEAAAPLSKTGLNGVMDGSNGGDGTCSSRTGKNGAGAGPARSSRSSRSDKASGTGFDEGMDSDRFRTSSDRTYEIITTGQGDAIVFLAGLAFTWKVWRHQIPALRNRYRLIFPHLPGHGASVSESGEFTFEDIADDLAEILDHYNIAAAHLAGWCMGGNIAQLFAARHQDKLKSLALIGTTGTDAGARGMVSEDVANYSANPLETYEIEFQNCLQNHPLRASLPEMYMRYLRDSYCKTDNVSVINYTSSLFRFDSSALVSRISVPTLVVAGKWDLAFPPDQVALLHRQITNSEYVEFDQSGHLPFLTQSDLFNRELLKFLSGREQPGKMPPERNKMLEKI